MIDHQPVIKKLNTIIPQLNGKDYRYINETIKDALPPEYNFGITSANGYYYVTISFRKQTMNIGAFSFVACILYRGKFVELFYDMNKDVYLLYEIDGEYIEQITREQTINDDLAFVSYKIKQ